MTQLSARRVQRIAALLFAATIPALAVTSALAQSSLPDTSTLKLNSRLTQVDITATDTDGHPVHGLTQSDFTVKEDGKPQPIKNFEEFGIAKPTPPAPTPQLPPNVYTNAQPRPPTTEAINVILMDDVTTGSGLRMVSENVANSRAQALKYLQTMPSGTQAIILELGVKLRVIQGLTTNRDVLLAALHSVSYVQNARTSLPMCDPTATKKDPAYCGVPPIFDACSVANAQSQTIVDTLGDVSAYLSGIKGRKNLIWFTPGVPWLTNFGDYDALTCLHDYTAALLRDYNLLAAAHVAIYSVDPSGILPFPPKPGIYPGEGSMIPPPSNLMIQANDHFSMEDFAASTGGHAYYNTNDLAAAIRDAIAIGTDYYSLSYVPPLAKYDGQFHKIAVTVARPGVHLEYRKGYASIDPAKAPPTPVKNASPQGPPTPDAQLYASMAHGAAPSTEILFTLAVTPTTPPTHPGDPVLGQLNPNLKLKGKLLVRYDFNYSLQPDQLTLTDAPNGQHQGAIEFTVAAYDVTGEMLNVLRQTASFTVTPFQFSSFYQHKLPMLLQLDLPPGPCFLRAAIRDVPSNRVGSLEIPLTVK